MDVNFFPRLPEALAGAQGHRVVNLRPRMGIDGHTELVAAMPPITLAHLRGYRPVCRFGNNLIVSNRGNVLGRADCTDAAAMPSAGLAALPGAPLCSLPTGGDEAIVMTEGGAARVSMDGDMPRAEVCDYEYPALTLRAVQASLASASVPARTLSKTYADTRGLSAADREALTGDLEQAYAEAAAKAAAAGCMVQPALARFRLLGRRGKVLFESAPVLLSLPEVSQCADTIEVRCADGHTTSAYEVALKAWRIEVSIPAADMPGVAAAEVTVSPQFHPYRSGGRGMAVLARDAEGYKVRVGLPGAYRALGANRGGTERAVMDAMARMEAIESTAGRINAPFDGTARTVALVYSPEADAAAAGRALDTALRAKTVRAGFAEALLAAPHRFAARAVASDGVLVAWGAPRVLRYEGYPLPMFAAATRDIAWRATVTVKFDGRRGVTRYMEGDTACPTALGPVLSYPAPDARSMSIVLAADGETRRFDCELRPDDSGRRAVYIAPDLKPIEPALSAAGAIVDIENADEDFAEVIATARADDPLRPGAIVRHGCGAVGSLAAVGGAEQAWERGRSRFFAVCRGGIISMAISASGQTSVRTVDRRGSERHDSLAAAGETVCALVEAPGGRVPLGLSARGSVRQLAPAADYLFPAYDSREGELWLVKTAGGADVIAGGGMYGRSCPAYTEAAELGGEWFGTHVGGVDRLSVPAASGRVAIEYDAAFSPAARGAFSLHSLRADIGSGGIGGTLEVSASDGAGTARRSLVRRAFAGALKSPMEIRTAGAPARSLAVSLRAMAEAGTAVRSFHFRLSWSRK